MKKTSAGIILYQIRDGTPEIFLAHPGGPFWAKKDSGAWSIPKGEFSEDEDPLQAARREFKEETGFNIDGNFIKLEPIKQPSGKIIHAWAVAGDFDAPALVSNKFSLEWPPKSGNMQEFPEVDRGEWFDLNTAKEKIIKGQLGFISQMENYLKG